MEESQNGQQGTGHHEINNGAAGQQQNIGNNNNNNNNNDLMVPENPRFGTVRDRLFQTLLIRLSLPYYQSVPLSFRRLFEFLTLLNALSLLSILIYTHFLLNTFPGRCLDGIREEWPRKGIVRLEVIQNLAEFREWQARRENEGVHQNCHFDIAEILRKGVLPAELRSAAKHSPAANANQRKAKNNLLEQKKKVLMERPLPIWMEMLRWLAHIMLEPLEVREEDEGEWAEWEGRGDGGGEAKESVGSDLHSKLDDVPHLQIAPFYHHLVEFSLHYGLLKLNMDMRNELDVEVLQIQLDPEQEECFRDWRETFLMRHLIGMDELVLSSVKQMLENETDRGYLRDLIGGELYHFVTVGPSSSSTYMTALVVMLVFTFAISMLLRFSHDQIFVFIVDLFQMLEQNQPLIFPVAPLLTVILALVGMEAIMSEIFNDTTTAFYVILIVWVADQYDAIFCHSLVGRRHWLRFFYLYHFAFYAYHYRYNGLYGGFALLTSAAFILHSMVFFYHHYELPYIIRQEQDVNQPPNRADEPGAAADDAVRRDFAAMVRNRIELELGPMDRFRWLFNLLGLRPRRRPNDALVFEGTVTEVFPEADAERETEAHRERRSSAEAARIAGDRVAEEVVDRTLRELLAEVEERMDQDRV